MGPLRSVVLAGGGTGGHIYPLLAFADCLRRHDPDVRITCLGTPKGLENELIPPAGYDLRHDPGVPAAPVGQHGPGRTPDRMLQLVRARPARCSTRSRPTWWSASAATSRCRPTWPRGGARLPIVIHEVNVPPGVANRLGMRFTKHVAVGFPHQPTQAESLRDARVVGVPLRPSIATLDRAGRRGRGPRALRAATPTCRRCSSPAARRAPARSTWRSPARPRSCPAAGVQVLHVIGARNEPVDDPDRPAGAVRDACRTCAEMELGTRPPT